MATEKLAEDTVRKLLTDLPRWKYQDGTLQSRFRFSTFVEAFGWMTSVALVAESMDHHPDWSNVYNHVDVRLSTHDAGGVTEKDFRLAREMDRLGGSR